MSAKTIRESWPIFLVQLIHPLSLFIHIHQTAIPYTLSLQSVTIFVCKNCLSLWPSFSEWLHHQNNSAYQKLKFTIGVESTVLQYEDQATDKFHAASHVSKPMPDWTLMAISYILNCKHFWVVIRNMFFIFNAVIVLLCFIICKKFNEWFSFSNATKYTHTNPW